MQNVETAKSSIG